MTYPSRPFHSLAAALLSCGIFACTDTPGEISRDSKPFDGIDEQAVVTAGGTEPFWSLTITPGGQGIDATYSTPELLDGVQFPVARFAGNNGLGFSGQMEGQAVNLALTPGSCSDGMSDRTYPYTATMLLGDATLYGCAHTSDEPYTPGEAE
jgi:uncharacterized membrane protein